MGGVAVHGALNIPAISQIFSTRVGDNAFHEEHKYAY